MERPPALSTLGKCYFSGVALAALVMVLIVAAPSSADEQDWSILAYVLSLYFVLAICQFVVVVALSVFHRRFVQVMVGYIAIAIIINFVAFGASDGAHSILMPVILAAAIYVIFVSLTQRAKKAL